MKPVTVPAALAARRRAIHAAARQLAMREEDRRALISGCCGGKTSTTDLSEAECEQVLDRMRALGAARQPAGERVRYVGRHPGHPEFCRRGCQARLEKVEAQLADMQLPWAYAKTILRQQQRTERLEWATGEQLDGVIAALFVEQQKRRLLARVDALLAETGRHRGDAQTWVDSHAPARSGTWTRHRDTLARLAEWLDAGR